MNAISMTATAAQAFACTLDRKAFAAALTLADKVTEARNTIPILSHVRLTLAGDVLTIEATDLDLFLSIPVECADATGGTICAELKALKATAKKMTGARIGLSHVGPRVVVTDLDRGASSRTASLPASDWPEFTAPQDGAAIEFPAAQLLHDLARIAPAVSTEETRYYLNGIFFHPYCSAPAARVPEHDALTDELAALGDLDQADVDALPMNWRNAVQPADERPRDLGAVEVDESEYAARAVAMLARKLRAVEIGERINILEAERTRPDALRMAATDGHRLHYVTRPLPAGAEALAGSIIPRKAIKVARDIMGKKPAGEARLTFCGSRFSLDFGGMVLAGKLIDGTFPDYTRVIPSYNSKALGVAADEVADLIETVTAHCTDRERAICLSLSREGVVFSARSHENGLAAAAAMDAPEYDADELGIGFNAGYLATAVKQFPGARLIVDCEDAAAPTLIRSADVPEFQIVLMPMRTDHSVLTPAGIEKLDRDAWTAFAEDAGRLVERAMRESAQAMPKGREARDMRNRTSRTAWQELAALANAAKGLLIAGGTAKESARLAVRSIILPAMGKTAEAERAQRFATWTMDGINRGSFAALGNISLTVTAVTPEPIESREPEEPAPTGPAGPQPTEPPAAPEVEPEPEAAPEPVREPEPVDVAPEAQPAGYDALAARVEALEAMLRQLTGADVPAAPQPVQPAAVEEGERGELIAEIDRLRAEVAAQAVTIARLTASRGRVAGRLRFMGGAVKRERVINAQLLGQIADMLKRRPELETDSEPVSSSLPRLPASLRPPAIELPAVMTSARPTVEA